MRAFAFAFVLSLAATGACNNDSGTTTPPPPPVDMAMRPPDLAPAATCTDNTQNGVESDTDCGGTSCSPCIVGKKCKQNSDCISGSCTSMMCQTAATCTAGFQILAASRTFTLPAGCVGPARVLVVGGGGAGGAYPGSGGGSGYVKAGSYTLTGSVQVTVGAPGMASSFGAMLSAMPGSDGQGGDGATGGAGGSSGGGKYSGNPGGRGGMNGGKGGERNNELDNGGATSQGAPYPLSTFTKATITAGMTPATNFEGGGGGGGVVINNSTVNGNDSLNTGYGGMGYGAGGGGGNGGTGAPGVVYVEWDK